MTTESVEDALTGADRRHLRRLAHELPAVVQVGGRGLSDGVVSAVDRALDDHELIKLRIDADRPARRALAVELARRTDSALAGTVGRVAILYRPARDPERRRIALPSQRSAARL